MATSNLNNSLENLIATFNNLSEFLDKPEGNMEEGLQKNAYLQHLRSGEKI